MFSNANETSAEAPQLQPDLSSPRLPPEILDRILDHIDTESWFYHNKWNRVEYGGSISLVCRAWRERGTAWVWSRVDLDLTGPNRTLEHMLEHPRTIKGLEVLCTTGPLPYDNPSPSYDIRAETVAERQYDQAIAPICRDAGRLVSLCHNLREFRISDAHRYLVDCFFPADSIATYPTIKTILLDTVLPITPETFIRVLRAIPNIAYLKIPIGTVRAERDSPTTHDSLVEPLPPLHIRELYLDWPITIMGRDVSTVVFKHVLPAIEPASLFRLSLSPIQRETGPLLQALLPTYTALEYLSLHFDGQQRLQDSLAQLAEILSGLSELRHLSLRNCELPRRRQGPRVSSDALGMFLLLLPDKLETLEIQAILPRTVDVTQLVPKNILDLIDWRVHLPLSKIKYRLRRGDRVSDVCIIRVKPFILDAVEEPNGSLSDLSESVRKILDVRNSRADGSRAENSPDVQPYTGQAGDSSLHHNPDAGKTVQSPISCPQCAERVVREGDYMVRYSPDCSQTLAHGWQIVSERCDRLQ